MGNLKQIRVDQLDLDAVRNQPTNGQAIAELEKQIRGLQYKLSDKVRQAITDQGIRVTDLSMQFGLSYSGISQILRHAFNMSIDTMDAFIKRLFPGKSVDEVCFGISRPTRIPMIPNLFMNIYEDLPSREKQAVRQKLTTSTKMMEFDREERVKEIYESNGSNRCYDETFSDITAAKTNSSSSQFWRATNEELASFRTRTYMRFATLSNYSMDYLCASDYTNCNLTLLNPEMKREEIPESKKATLRYFNMLPSKEARMDLVADMLATVALSD